MAVFRKKGIQVDVKRISSYLFWIKAILLKDFSLLNQMESVLIGSPIRRLDRWMEVLGPVLHPTWIRLVGILLHAWDEKVFRCLGNCLGVVMEIDDAAK